MKALIPITLLLALVQFSPVAFAANGEDARGSSDHPLFSRMPGFFISQYKDLEFDAFSKFMLGEGKAVSVEGRHITIRYALARAETRPSETQIARNFEQAVAASGGTLVAKKRNDRFFKLKLGAQTIWVKMHPANRGSMYILDIIEEAPMRQDVVADAGALADEISRTGKATVRGIFFDTGKSELSPKSTPALDEIAKLLKADSSLKLLVVGHTDIVGEFSANLSLSELRAHAVARALVKKYGVAAARLEAHGVGPLAPASTNASEEGRALNRRTELVAR